MTSSKLKNPKKSSIKPEEYIHKKFRYQSNKRKYDDLENNTPITVQTILQQAAKENLLQKPPAKRRKVVKLFRPWLDESTKKPRKPRTVKAKAVMPLQDLTAISNNIIQIPYQPNMIRQHPPKQRTEKEQQIRDRNTVACLQNRRKKQAERIQLQQQYVAKQQQQIVVTEQSVRSALYLRQLQQLILQTQHRVFVFGKQ